MIPGENWFPPCTHVPYMPVIEDLYSLFPEDIAKQVSVRVDREFIYAYARATTVVERGTRVARATKVGEDGSGRGKVWKTQHGYN